GHLRPLRLLAGAAGGAAGDRQGAGRADHAARRLRLRAGDRVAHPPARAGGGGRDAMTTSTRAETAGPVDSEVVIGLEVHAQLLTRSKMFCGCSAEYAGAPPNTHVCPVCFGMPGVLPVMNRRAVEFTLMTGLAIGASIPEASKFDRKNYPYP